MIRFSYWIRMPMWTRCDYIYLTLLENSVCVCVCTVIFVTKRTNRNTIFQCTVLRHQSLHWKMLLSFEIFFSHGNVAFFPFHLNWIMQWNIFHWHSCWLRNEHCFDLNISILAERCSWKGANRFNEINSKWNVCAPFLSFSFGSLKWRKNHLYFSLCVFVCVCMNHKQSMRQIY